MQDQILLPLVQTIINVSASTIRRLIKEDDFPKPDKIGNQLYFKKTLVYKWLSKQAGRDIVIGDKLLSSKQIETLFNRSSAWVWIHFQKNKKMKQKAVYIRSRPLWTESDIYADKTLSKYLEILNDKSVQEVA